VSLHTLCQQGPRKPSSCATFTLNFHWDRAATGKKEALFLHTQSHFGCVQLFVTLYGVACQFSVEGGRGVLQARILEHIGQYWLPYSS